MRKGDNMENEYSFTTTNEDGLEVKCDVLSVVNMENNSNPVVIYTDYTLSDDDKLNLYVSQLVEGPDGTSTLEQLDDYEGIPEVQAAVQKVLKEN